MSRELSYEEKETVKESVDHLTRFVNKYDRYLQEFAKQMMSEHRTLQQSTMRLFLTVIREWSKQENFDLRNEKTVKLCKTIMEAIQDQDHLPFI